MKVEFIMKQMLSDNGFISNNTMIKVPNNIVLTDRNFEEEKEINLLLGSEVSEGTVLMAEGTELPYDVRVRCSQLVKDFTKTTSTHLNSRCVSLKE